ncbi:EAL domain-containing protein [Polymorphospora sp. NPDC050346]|uniref:EAL domain-containing protein n=1 Tax=Polymorphospora sp. NPDC050346 TaxID=3155780 RepID=UPI0033FB1026
MTSGQAWPAPSSAPSGLRRIVPLTGAVLTLAITAVVLGPIFAGGSPGGTSDLLARLGIVAVVFAAGQLARLRLRVGSGGVSVTWGEAALIVGLHLVPAGWLPAATLVGAGVAWSILAALDGRRGVLEVLHCVASLTTAVGVAAAVTQALAPPLGAPLSPTLAGALLLGAATYLATTTALATVTMVIRYRRPAGPLLLRILRGKLLMFAGNVLVGLAAIVMIDSDPRWLLLVPPALWLLQQTYLHRVRADDEREAWSTLATAVGGLNRLDERAVVSAALESANRVFRAERVELDVTRADGSRRRYRLASDGELAVRAIPADTRPDADDQLHNVELTAGGTRVGDLRVRFSRGATPGHREEAALSIFGAALATALHDAIIHRELRILTSRSAYEAVHDPLTKLVNRAAMLSKGDVALHRLTHEHPVALLLLDINNFKEVNDTLGHAAGDELLQVTAGRLKASMRPGELLGRLGGDEFALLVTAVPVRADTAGSGSSLPAAMRRARDIVERLAVPVEVAGVKMSVEASVGVVVAGAGAADMTELLRRADIAMYQAKNGGSNIASYDSGRDAASTDQLALLAELREALAVDNQLVLHLQPAVDLVTGEPTGVEALIRWHHPRRGTLGPGDFVRAVEGSDLLAPFTRYVVDRALTVAAEWARAGLDVPISVNLSARSLLDQRLPAEVGESLRRHQVPAHRLVLEITETVVMSELDVIDDVLADLRALGVQLAVDDFGTGFSSLSFLARIAVHELKVDRSFVIGMVDSPEAAAIVRTTVELAHELGLRVVAEGVETADQRTALAALGCTSAQGYHFFRPMPADKIVAVLRNMSDSAQAQILPLRVDGVS